MTYALMQQIEACVWFAIAGTILIARGRRVLWLAIALFFFGASDLVEARTGAWWRPWWLFAWKAVCVLGIILAIASARYRARS